MTIEDKINKFIENEKDISKCKISILESISNLKPSKRRLLEIERSFVGFDFNSIGIKTIDECKEAITLFRSSRTLFYIKYNIPSGKVKYGSVPSSNFSGLKRDFSSASFKFKFLKDISSHLMRIRPQEINIVQSRYYFDKFLKFVESTERNMPIGACDLSSKSILDLAPYEPVVLSRQRAREQVSYFSIGYFLMLKAESLEPDFNELIKDYNLIFNESFDKELFTKKCMYIELQVDEVFAFLKENIYKHYNSGLERIGNLSGTMGANDSIARLRRLEDLFNNKRSFSSFGEIRLYKSGFTIDRVGISKISQTKSGIVFPIKRSGNEKMDVFYKKIFYKDYCISSLFNNRLSNVKAYSPSGELCYYKCLMMSKDIYSDILKNANFQDINIKDSSLFVSRTRSENECMVEAMKNIEMYLDDLSSDYLVFGNTINDRADRMSARKALVKKYFGQK